jgi:hypothetical protein
MFRADTFPEEQESWDTLKVRGHFEADVEEERLAFDSDPTTDATVLRRSVRGAARCARRPRTADREE